MVDPALIAVPCRQRRAKTDAIDGETLLRTLLAWKRGEPRVFTGLIPPSPEQEDRGRTAPERAVLLKKRVRHVNRIKGRLAGQGVIGYRPLHSGGHEPLEALMTGDGRPLPTRLKAGLLREIDAIELLMRQITDVGAELHAQSQDAPIRPVPRLKAIGPQIAAVLYLGRSVPELQHRVRLRPTPDWYRRHFAAARSIMSRASRRLATGPCAPS